MSVAVAPLLRAVSGGVFVSGATCIVYKTGTTTKVTIYSDAALTTPVTNPQTSDANGQFNFYVGSGENLRFYIQTAGGTLISDTDPVYPVPVNAKGTTIASASTVDLTTTVGDFVDVSGTTTITSFGSSGANRKVVVRFTGALILTHNASSLSLPGAANITTANGDIGVFQQISAGNWACLGYSKANGKPIALAINQVAIQVFTSSGTYTPTPGMIYCISECIGGGGGGGGIVNEASGSAGSAGGGGSGGYSKKISTAATIGASQVVTIGAGGTAGANTGSSGGTGGDTSVGTICIAKGGIGGGAGRGSGGGNGGASGTGDITSIGSNGGYGNQQSITTVGIAAGLGGSSIFGSGNSLVFATGVSNGLPGTSYGDGGNGGISWNAGGAAIGGTGHTGLIVITEFLNV